jgi:hypothetical protein
MTWKFIMAAGHFEPQRVEVARVELRHAERCKLRLQRPGQRVDPRGDRPQPLRTVIHGVHCRHVREQHLCGADVRRRLFAADVLFARGQRHPVSLMSVGVHRHADEAAGQLPDKRLTRREERRVRSAVSERYAKTLRVSEHDVGAHLAWGRDQRQRE